MAKKHKRRYRKNGTPSLLTVILRILIIVILCAAIIIVINRIAEVVGNDQKRAQLETAVPNWGEDTILAPISF